MYRYAEILPRVFQNLTVRECGISRLGKIKLRKLHDNPQLNTTNNSTELQHVRYGMRARQGGGGAIPRRAWGLSAIQGEEVDLKIL